MMFEGSVEIEINIWRILVSTFVLVTVVKIHVRVTGGPLVLTENGRYHDKIEHRQIKVICYVLGVM